MDLDRFTRLLATHGADLARWPADERDAASRLLGVSPDARAAWSEAARLEALFARDRPAVEPARRNAIATAALRRIRALPARDEAIGWRWLFSPALGAAFAATLVVGCFVGFQAGPPPSGAPLDIIFGGADRGVAGFIQ
jgi:hypothetical protein